jgi:hypothetical protein
MLVIVWNGTFSTTCPRKPNSIQNASEEFLFLQLKFDLLVHFETLEIAKMLHNVYKGSSIGKLFTVDLPCWL